MSFADLIYIDDHTHVTGRTILLCHKHDLSHYIGDNYAKLPYKTRKIHLKKGCSTGTDTLIMPGVTIGEGSIVGAGSLVIHDIKEFPISPAKVLGKPLPFSGGGYFRLIPLFLQKHFIEQMNYIMFYFHINDLIEQKTTFMSKAEYEEYFKEPGTLKNRVSRYIKANIGKGGALSKLDYLLGKYRYVNVEQATQIIDWKELPIIIL